VDHLRARDVVVLASGEAVIWAVVLFALLRQASKLAVPTTASLTREYVALQMPHGKAGARWTSFVRLKSTRHFWLFSVNRKCSLIIPKRAFPEGQRMFVDEFVRQVAPLTARRASAGTAA
jgi:hypothetical protein